jgi:hypothetical protein
LLTYYRITISESLAFVNHFNAFLQPVETVETVWIAARPPNTALKRGVNEKRQRRDPIVRSVSAVLMTLPHPRKSVLSVVKIPTPGPTLPHDFVLHDSVNSPLFGSPVSPI